MFVDKDGNGYHPRQRPYLESELPSYLLERAVDYLTEVTDDYIAPAIQTVVPHIIDENKRVTDRESDKKVKADISFVPREPELIDKSKLSPDVSEFTKEANKEPRAINLKTASVEELDALPYITEAIAQKVIKARESGTVFSTTSDLDAAFKLPFGKTWKDTGIVIEP